MPLGSVYGSKESDLFPSDQDFLEKYRTFHEPEGEGEGEGHHTASAGTHKSISKSCLGEYIHEVLRYHSWACMDKKKSANDVHFAEILLSYDDLQSFCAFRLTQRKVQKYSLGKTYEAVISMVKFMKEKIADIIDLTHSDEMLKKTRSLLAGIAREAAANRKQKPPPSFPLSFLDLEKVFACQQWRVKVLSVLCKIYDTSVMLASEVKKLLVLYAAIFPNDFLGSVTKSDIQRAQLTLKEGRYCLKIPGIHYEMPLHGVLSPHDCKVISKYKENETGPWNLFQGLDVSKVIKALTLEMTGVSHVTHMSVKSIVKAYKRPVKYFEGQLQYDRRIDKELKGMETKLDDIATIAGDEDDCTTVMEMWSDFSTKLKNVEYVDKITTSQAVWVEGAQKSLRETEACAKMSVKEAACGSRKRRAIWSVEEDQELRKCVHNYGDGNWSSIIDNSPILRYRYKTSTVEKARENVKTRWRKLKPASNAAIEYPPHDWLVDEDSALKYAVAVHGKDWRKILDNTKVLQDLVEHLPADQAQHAICERWYSLQSGTTQGSIAVDHQTTKPMRKTPTANGTQYVTRRREASIVTPTKGVSHRTRSQGKNDKSYVGSRIGKEFFGKKVYYGSITSFDKKKGFWHAKYDDGDSEDLDHDDLLMALELNRTSTVKEDGFYDERSSDESVGECDGSKVGSDYDDVFDFDDAESENECGKKPTKSHGGKAKSSNAKCSPFMNHES